MSYENKMIHKLDKILITSTPRMLIARKSPGYLHHGLSLILNEKRIIVYQEQLARRANDDILCGQITMRQAALVQVTHHFQKRLRDPQNCGRLTIM